MKFFDQMDHYDTYTYLLIGPISFFCALLFIVFTLCFKESRAFPGNLLIIISFAELGLCIHWFLSALNTKYILGIDFEIKDESPFCQMNSILAFGLGSIELYCHMSFLIAIIVILKNTMKKIKFVFFFWLAPVVLAGVSLLVFWKQGKLGKNLYGTCSIKQSDNLSVPFFGVLGSYVIIGGYALMQLRKFIYMQKSEIIYRDNFYKFYSNYTILIFVLYINVGLNYYLVAYIKKCAMDATLIDYCHRVFFISRLTNNVKIFIPLWAFLVRIKDPFLRKLASRMIERRLLGKKVEQQDKEDGQQTELMIMNKIKEIRQGIVRTILVGLQTYFASTIYIYERT